MPFQCGSAVSATSRRRHDIDKIEINVKLNNTHTMHTNDVSVLFSNEWLLKSDELLT